MMNIPAAELIPTMEDRDSGGWDFLSWFFPFVGLILFLVWKDTYPRRAKGCGKWALVSVVTEVVLSITFGIMFLILGIFGISLLELL